MRQDPIDTVVLDMDGTLLDLNFDDMVWNKLLPQRVAASTGRTLAAAAAHVRTVLESERGTLRWYCLDHWSEVFGVAMGELEREMSEYIRPRPGTLEFLTGLSALELTVVLATNAHPRSLALKLERMPIGRYFDHLISSHRFGAPKEDTAFWHRLVEETGCVPQRSLLVDDNPTVLAAARDCGMRALFGITRPSSTGPVKRYAEFASVDSLTELLPWLTARASTKSAI